MTKLLIDTTSREEISVTLEHGEARYHRQFPARLAKAQTVLPLTEELLAEAKLNLKDINEIEVAQGGQSLTGVRVGFAIANMLGLLLSIPVNGKKALALPRPHPLHYKRIQF